MEISTDLKKKNIMMLELVKKIANYSKTERIQRLIEISVKSENATTIEQMEHMIIQFIREQNGEIVEVKKMNKITDEIDSRIKACFTAFVLRMNKITDEIDKINYEGEKNGYDSKN